MFDRQRLSAMNSLHSQPRGYNVEIHDVSGWQEFPPCVDSILLDPSLMAASYRHDKI